MILAIVQARTGSTRLPGKVLKKVQDRSLIEILLYRLKKSKLIDKIIVATTNLESDDKLARQIENIGIQVYRGDEKNVLERYYYAAMSANADTIVRITGDCPLIDAIVVDRVISRYQETDSDYVSNICPATYPDGLDVEVFSFKALKKAFNSVRTTFEKEHVTVFLRESGKFKTSNVSYKVDHSNKRWTVDEVEDLEFVLKVFQHFDPRLDFSWEEAIDVVDSDSAFLINDKIPRNEGSNMSTGQKLWKRAKKVIPGGNMLLSKRSEMFLPEQWPSYFSKTEGCEVWDLDGNVFLDMSLMGVGTNILGYSHPDVDAAVHDVINKGNMSTLNAPEEVFLAEKLIDMHPFANMARFCRSGGEANAVAIRIARAASGKDKVAFCGYHGWHDWYLAANLGDGQNLAGHLLPGLEPRGVPSDLAGSVLPFNYNRFDELDYIVTNYDVGVIKMEVSRNKGPENDFLQRVRRLATEKNIVLIFDECTSGFRESFGGLHKKYNVEPDIAVFGKALGNGYAITSVIGSRDVMEAAQSTFISSTFWTERIGSAAALKTLEIMQNISSWDIITEQGNQIRRRWQKLADLHHLNIEHWGIPALCGFSFIGGTSQEYKTLMTQIMFENGILGGTSIYSSVAHKQDHIDRYFDVADEAFRLISKCENDVENINNLLSGPISHTQFKRLN